MLACFFMNASPAALCSSQSQAIAACFALTVRLNVRPSSNRHPVAPDINPWSKCMRVTEKPISSYPWYLRPFFWNQQRKYGQVLKPALIWARVPKLFAAVAMLYGVLDRKSSPINPVLRSLITVRVSQINQCRFCIDINSAVLAKRTGSMNKIEALEGWRESELFNDKERLVLEYAEAVTYTGRQVDENLSQRLHQYFNEDEIVELTGLIAFQNLSSKFNSALDLPAQGFCRLPGSKDNKAG
jgi:AhpD family alkylhydroperoxidase